MPANYVLLEKITVGAAGASSVTFSGIPQTGYTDLVVKASTRNDASNNSIYVSLNGSTTSFTSLFLYSTSEPGSASSYNLLPRFLSYGEASTYTASTFASTEMYLPNYTSANYKSWSVDGVAENNATRAENALTAGLWSNTAAITSISLAMASGNFVQYSTFYLYGVAKLGTTPAIVPYATGGDTIMTDGTYWYHTFISSGTFTPQKSLSCDYLVVAGGGGGAGGNGGPGGGGAGGLRSTVTATGGGGSLESALSLASGTGYTVTIGAGGSGGGANANGVAGSNSVFATITSTGGGYGGAYATGSVANAGGPGGSGGGGGSVGGTNGAGGTRTASPVQGFNGGIGTGVTAVVSWGGGGGGAGEAGNTDGAGEGGDGVATSISGSSVTYGGGGGGANDSGAGVGFAGGTGGGGAGSGSGNGTAGTANTGGGGGSGRSSTGGAGGSGIVIVRYAV